MLWRKIVTELALEYPDVELTHMYVDNAAMQLVSLPETGLFLEQVSIICISFICNAILYLQKKICINVRVIISHSESCSLTPF